MRGGKSAVVRVTDWLKGAAGAEAAAAAVGFSVVKPD
jgi:hypothetical protein